MWRCFQHTQQQIDTITVSYCSWKQTSAAIKVAKWDASALVQLNQLRLPSVVIEFGLVFFSFKSLFFCMVVGELKKLVY